MDGMTFLRKIMEQHPVPVVICSSLAEEGSDVLSRAMEYGAVEIIQKPKLATKIVSGRVQNPVSPSRQGRRRGTVRPLHPHRQNDGP